MLEDIPHSELAYISDLYCRLRGCPHIRISEDTIYQQPIMVYRYFSDHLLDLVQENLPIHLVKQILKATLRGIAALHERDIIHTGNA